ncbi:uncharacterized protein LAJ45_10416 [Morchella importuna]|uniref:uncharacterized protein n=1 Tax=Morchella importuna TaxID=1174673 RepID=UPI001E8D8FD6|nr:uncharacterized protein LAJ45_10416 [Morchella importuna]KAH8145615.1 hypothetical protein LAJ45_10416 [Morchella importuna]
MPAPMSEEERQRISGNSALKRAESGFRRAPLPRSSTTPGAIVSAMEITQPGSSAKLLAAKDGDTKKSKRSKKKAKKDKKKEGEAEEQKDGETETEQPKPKMEVTVKHLEKRFDDQGHRYLTEPGSEPPKKATEDKWANYILCEITHFNWEQKVCQRSLEVKSKHLKAVLRKVIGDQYPGVSFRTVAIKLSFPLNSLYHYLEELKAELEVMKKASAADTEKKEETNGGANEKPKNPEEEKLSKEDAEEAIAHLEYLVNYLEIEFDEVIKDVANLLPQGLISYEILWTIFKPGRAIYARSHHDQQRCLQFERGDYINGNEPRYSLDVKYVDYDGKYFGMTQTTVPILPFEGTMKITSLAAFPLEYHPKKDVVSKFLIERGRRFEGLKGCHYMEYTGVGLGETIRCGRAQYSIKGRVMCDKATYNRINPDRGIMIVPLPGQAPQSEDGENLFMKNNCELPTTKPLTDEQCLLASFLISGFALSEKKWVDFYIDNLSPIQWNENAFDQLVLPPSQKSLVRALVESHVRDLDGFDDIIKGKGKGFISILHGPPGVGKTLTAESVAEHTRRPLYAVSSGELGVNPKDLEDNLSRILDVATQWKAVLLLDEADVFLETRSLHDLTRNSLVSIFLRLLEYYQGILFLTSNRVTTFDEAFQSRIHVALKYNKLDRDARMQVWKNFMNFDDLKGGKELLESVIDRELNGRQIKNCVRTARSLAESEGKRVDLSHLMVVLDIQQRFENDFGGLITGAVTNGISDTSNGKM